jgi:hypothetical protein
MWQKDLASNFIDTRYIYSLALVKSALDTPSAMCPQHAAGYPINKLIDDDKVMMFNLTRH